jgi:DNA invertase Pin-like site-specific DNA recombinase
MKHAVIYTRVSTQEQAADHHHSLAAQLRICHQAAEEKGYQVVAHFQDAGKSATSMKRPGLQDLLVHCEQHSSVEAVFVQDTDRLARNTQDHLAIRSLFARYKVQLVSVSQPLLEDSAEGRMIDTIIASVNQFQSDLTARKVLKGMEEKARNGGWPGKAPIGYRNVVIDQKHLVRPDPKTAPAIKRAFQFYATGQYTLGDLARMLADEGVHTRRGRPLHTSRTQEMLKNPFYISQIRWGNLRSEGKHPPLVSKSLFASVKKRLEARAHPHTRAHLHSFLLRGLLVCGACGRRLVGEIHPKKGNLSYYRCHSGQRCGPCLPKPKSEEQLLEVVRAVHFSRSFLDAIRKDLLAEAGRARKEALSSRATAMNRRKGLEARQQLLDRKLLAGTVQDSEYRRLQDQILRELEALDEELNRLDTLVAPRVDLFDRVREVVEDLPRLYEQAPDDAKRLYLSLFWKDFIVVGGEIVDDRPTDLLRGLLEAQQTLIDPTIPPEAGGMLPPPASKRRDVHRIPKDGRQGAPNRHTSNRLFQQLTEHFEHFSAQLDQLHSHHPQPPCGIPSSPESSK